MLRCTDCECVSRTAPGWVAVLVEDPDVDEGDEHATVAIYCPPCAGRVLAFEPSVDYT
jgi:hypothetical protein